MKFEQFQKETSEEMKAAGWRLLLANAKQPNNFRGYVDAVRKELSVQTEGIWQPIYIHEYCHFKQQSGSEFVGVGFTMPFIDAIRHGDTVNRRELDKSCLMMQRCEADAERNTIRLIKEKEIEIDGFDCKEYIKGANAYILSYELMKRAGQWFDTHPRFIKELTRLVPNDSIVDDSELSELPKGFIKAGRLMYDA